jgi:CheY-like chemotaxis protein
VSVRGAGDGDEAIRLIVERLPDVVLCDIERPASMGSVRQPPRDSRFRRILTVATAESEAARVP